MVVGDRTYATLKRLSTGQGLAPPITCLTRLRLDAALPDPPPPRRPGPRGRPRIVGPVSPPGRRSWPTRPRSGPICAHAGPPTVYLRGRRLRDPTGRRAPEALRCTDPDGQPTAMLTTYRQRGPVAVTCQEVRTHLGVATQRPWSAAAIARTTPVLLGLFSGLILVAHGLRRRRPLRPRQAAWYAKRVPTFADVLAAIRHDLWTQALPFSLSPSTPDIQKLPQPPPAPLLAALCYSA